MRCVFSLFRCVWELVGVWQLFDVCVKLSDHMHTSTPALPHFTKATVSAKVLFVFWRTLSQTRVEKLWYCPSDTNTRQQFHSPDDKITLEEILISTGDISNSITAWYPLLIMRNSLKLTLELLLESETIWVSFWSFKQRRWGDWHQVVTNRVEVYV